MKNILKLSLVSAIALWGYPQSSVAFFDGAEKKIQADYEKNRQARVKKMLACHDTCRTEFIQLDDNFSTRWKYAKSREGYEEAKEGKEFLKEDMKNLERLQSCRMKCDDQHAADRKKDTLDMRKKLEDLANVPLDVTNIPTRARR